MEVENRLFDGKDETVEVVAQVRTFVAGEVSRLDRDDLVDDAVLVASELATNAVLHGGGITRVHVEPLPGAVRIEVHDRNRVPPVLSFPTNGAMTGRGVRLVDALATRWNAEPTDTGKVVWAELSPGRSPRANSVEELLELWSDDAWADDDWSGTPAARFHIELGDVPTDLLLAAKTHVDNLVREFTLAEGGAWSGLTEPLPANLAALLRSVVTGFAEARQSIRHQAVVGATKGLPRVRLELTLPAEAADAGEEYLRALDEADTYCRAARLLTLETPPQHRVFRHWYVSELVGQLRAAAAGLPAPEVESFESRLLREIDEAAAVRLQLDRAARMYEVSAALAEADNIEMAASAVLEQGIAVLAASGAGLLIAQNDGTMLVGATLGYDEAVVSRLDHEPIAAELPAAVALRTGRPVWLESRDERSLRFPQLVDLERDTVSMCAVPLTVGERRIGALRFSFSDARLFDEDERRFVLGLAAVAAQALDRAQLQGQRSQLSERLERTLLPRTLPDVPEFDVGAVFRSGALEPGGDFYDLWRVGADVWAFAIGDTTVRGAEGVALAAMVRFGLRALSAADPSPTSVLTRLNEALVRSGPVDLGGERSCTVVFGLLTPGRPSEVHLAASGQPSLIASLAGVAPAVIGVRGSPLGAGDDPAIGDIRITFGPGDVLALYTDASEQTPGAVRSARSERARAALAHAPADAAATAAAVEASLVTPDQPLVEDAAVLVIRALPS